ncbi:translocon-associated protein subunit beta [Cucumis melo var. makuwa]|uniref:Translocon-associated protein subunit beta n=1 Tax=Cucumis melo var. makuwa TaxID=1194695 RepID=A0A5D3DTY4_CUCMM|nr:translocon-associated protein subunit beta [Cucumis melo var. makuwa]TYK27227.1 translocon-associated protein subunit beta [Cucumis melo var. makuwa]
MAHPFLPPLIRLLFAFLFLSSTIATSDVPFIVAHKKASLTRLKSGAERVSVSIDIYNQGSSTAYDVSLNDASWPGDMFDIVSGETSNSWERLDAGGHVSHSFELEAKSKGMFHGSPAVVTFRVPTKSALQEALSTPILPLDVLADRPPEKKFEWVKRLLTKYGSLISVISIIVLFIYLVASPSKSAAKGSKKKR